MSQPSVPRPVALSIQLTPCPENFSQLLHGSADDGHCQLTVSGPDHSISYTVHLTAAEARHLFGETSKLATHAIDICAGAKKRADEKRAADLLASQKKEDEPTPN